MLRYSVRRAILVSVVLACSTPLRSQDDDVMRVFLFAGQSNMIGADSKVRDIARFPPFSGLDEPQHDVMFSYCIGRKNKTKSKGWVALQPVNGMVGPELSFARKVKRHIEAKIAIIKCAAGGTHLGGDWNPDDPIGFKLYPLTLRWVREALADLDRRKIRYRIEGFVWHQGENDMFVKDYMPAYGKNLANFLARWRRDLRTPKLRFYVGELCTKTIWGMDLRPRMYAISRGQKSVTAQDPRAEYVPTSHVGVEIGNPVGLHYHYGTLGQLQHGENYADAYLRNIGKLPTVRRELVKWPYAKGSAVRLFVLAGHRNMEGERAFTQQLDAVEGGARLLRENAKVAYRYSLGGGYRASRGWEPLGPVGYYDTFGPELSFAATLQRRIDGNIAIAKFTHGGTQIIDWTPEGSMAKSRNIYGRFLDFVRDALRGLRAKGHDVELAGVFYHVGENDMSFSPYRKQAAQRIRSLVEQSRRDLDLPKLDWFVSQQPPTDHESVNRIDVTAALAKVAARDPHMHHIKVFDLAGREQRLVITTEGIVELGQRLARSYTRQ